ncbi:MAG: hypothetical protein ABI615_12455, partial [Chthoniobacterales bacterium]
YDQAGMHYDPAGGRIQRLGEAIAVLKGLFAEAPLTFAGTHYTISNLVLSLSQSGAAHPYDTLPGISSGVTIGNYTNTSSATLPAGKNWKYASSNNYNGYILRVDPRTPRFGVHLYPQTVTPDQLPTPSDLPLTWLSGPKLISIGSTTNAPSVAVYNFGGIANYSSTGSFGYKDNDGFLRAAEGAYGSFTTATEATRPIVLGRPFYSVGELGYVFRDVPWKNLDMYTANSGDSGLLDIFTLHESPAITGDRINLNTYSLVLSALLNPGYVSLAADHVTPTKTISSTINPAMNTNAVASVAVGLTNGLNAILNPSDIVSKWTPLTVANPTANPVGMSKMEREAVARAIATQDDQRTYNFMIDLIYQMGQTKTTSEGDADNAPVYKFIATAERHVWIHVAIDRVTGQVVGKEIEWVQE